MCDLGEANWGGGGQGVDEDQKQSTTWRWRGDVMRRASTRAYPRQEGKGQDRSYSSVRFVCLMSGHCSPCFCSVSRLTHDSRKPGARNTVASTAPSRSQRGGSGWFLDAPFYFSLTPGLFSSNLVHRPSPFGCICIPTLPTVRPRLHLHCRPILSLVPSVHCCRWPVSVGLLTPILMYLPHPYPRLSSHRLVDSSAGCGVEGSQTSMQVVGP